MAQINVKYTGIPFPKGELENEIGSFGAIACDTSVEWTISMDDTQEPAATSYLQTEWNMTKVTPP